MQDASPLTAILESVLKESMGLNISSMGTSVIKHAINRRMRTLGIDNNFQYLQKIKTSVVELHELIDEVAVNETWFFRDEAPFLALGEYAAGFTRHKKGQVLRLLSIPCSSGEEPYSMAITLLEAGLTAASFVIDAVDISRQSLNRAREGVYRGNSFRSPLAQRYQRYFTKTRQGYALDPAVKALVRFHRGNLIHLNRTLASAAYQVVFCRNLLIYLDASFHQQAINTFEALLADDGLLFVGHAEAGIFSGSRFVQAPYPKAFAFHKRGQTPPLAQTPADPGADGKEAQSWGLSASFVETERRDLEIERHEELLRLNGPSAELFLKLAAIFETRKDWGSTIKMLKKAIYLDPNSIEAVDMLAAIYQRLGDEKNYQACLNRGRRIVNRMTASISSEKA